MITDSAHFINSENCNGESISYWRQFLCCSNGSYVCGTGVTKEEAEMNANTIREKMEDFLSLTPIQQLSKLIEQEQISPHDQQIIIRILSNLVIKIYKSTFSELE